MPEVLTSDLGNFHSKRSSSKKRPTSSRHNLEEEEEEEGDSATAATASFEITEEEEDALTTAVVASSSRTSNNRNSNNGNTTTKDIMMADNKHHHHTKRSSVEIELELTQLQLKNAIKKQEQFKKALIIVHKHNKKLSEIVNKLVDRLKQKKEEEKKVSEIVNKLVDRLKQKKEEEKKVDSSSSKPNNKGNNKEKEGKIAMKKEIIEKEEPKGHQQPIVQSQKQDKDNPKMRKEEEEEEKENDNNIDDDSSNDDSDLILSQQRDMMILDTVVHLDDIQSQMFEVLDLHKSFSSLTDTWRENSMHIPDEFRIKWLKAEMKKKKAVKTIGYVIQNIQNEIMCLTMESKHLHRNHEQIELDRRSKSSSNNNKQRQQQQLQLNQKVANTPGRKTRTSPRRRKLLPFTTEDENTSDLPSSMIFRCADNCNTMEGVCDQLISHRRSQLLQPRRRFAGGNATRSSSILSLDFNTNHTNRSFDSHDNDSLSSGGTYSSWGTFLTKGTTPSMILGSRPSELKYDVNIYYMLNEREEGRNSIHHGRGVGVGGCIVEDGEQDSMRQNYELIRQILHRELHDEYIRFVRGRLLSAYTDICRKNEWMENTPHNNNPASSSSRRDDELSLKSRPDKVLQDCNVVEGGQRTPLTTNEKSLGDETKEEFRRSLLDVSLNPQDDGVCVFEDNNGEDEDLGPNFRERLTI